MTQLTTIDTNNYAAMAKAMGIANEGLGTAKTYSLSRMRINHSPILGDDKILVKGGTFKLDSPDGTYYAQSAKVRPYLQRFMYKRWSNDGFVKTVMADSLNIDLKDNFGGFNCGKPAGYIKDFKALPENMQNLIKQIKRVRVVLGTVDMINATDEAGNAVDVKGEPFIWEIDNREAFKEVGSSFETLAKMQRLPVQHSITLNTEERKLQTGGKYYVPIASLDVTNVIELTNEDQEMFGDLMSWVDNYNSYIINLWSEKVNSNMDDDDSDIVDDLVDIEVEEEVV
jgi:hypothetical protein